MGNNGLMVIPGMYVYGNETGSWTYGGILVRWNSSLGEDQIYMGSRESLLTIWVIPYLEYSYHTDLY